MTTIKTSQKLKLNPNEIAFRKIYKGLLEQGKISAIFRPGQRLCDDYRGYCSEQKATIKIIDKIGADWAMLPPKFVKGFSKKVIIKKIETKTLSEFKKSDFVGASPDIQDKESLIYNLGVIYNIPMEEFTADFLITKTTFIYV